jgi:hypothetical protein
MNSLWSYQSFVDLVVVVCLQQYVCNNVVIGHAGIMRKFLS